MIGAYRIFIGYWDIPELYVKLVFCTQCLPSTVLGEFKNCVMLITRNNLTYHIANVLMDQIPIKAIFLNI